MQFLQVHKTNQVNECVIAVKIAVFSIIFWFCLNTVCSLPADPGTCKDTAKEAKRVYYDKKDQICQEFVYSGCGGNGNNFQDESDCLRLCKGV